jgi:hypothetical protein
VYDSAATVKAREDIANSVEPIRISLKRGQVIVREGDTITFQVLSEIAAIRIYSATTKQLNRFLGLLVIITALYWVAWKFMQHRGFVTRLRRRVAGSARDLAAENDRLTRAAYVEGRGTSLELVAAAQTLRETEIQLALRDFELVRARVLAVLTLATCPW